MIKRTYMMAMGLALVILLSACATATSGGNRGQQNELTREQIGSVDVATLYEVVQRLRPRWLEVRSTDSFGNAGGASTVIVVQSQSVLGGVDVLRQLSPDAAYSLWYLDGASASAAYPVGGRNVEAAIVIETAPRS